MPPLAASSANSIWSRSLESGLSIEAPKQRAKVAHVRTRRGRVKCSQLAACCRFEFGHKAVVT
jgi:hypothetical protein